MFTVMLGGVILFSGGVIALAFSGVMLAVIFIS